MRIFSSLKFYRYIFSRENYSLFARAWQATRLVRQYQLATAAPNVSSTIAAIEEIKLPRQPHWQISDIRRIYLFASFICGANQSYGKCVERSLIVYRLLGGYGIAAQVCLGVNRQAPQQQGHAWVELAHAPDEAFGETAKPSAMFQCVYKSSLSA